MDSITPVVNYPVKPLLITYGSRIRNFPLKALESTARIGPIPVVQKNII